MGEAALTWENELTELDLHAATACAGRARLVTLVGDRLQRALVADECAADRSQDGFVVLRARLEQSVAGRPAGSVVTALVSALSAEQWATAPAGSRATLIALRTDAAAGEGLPIDVPFAFAELLGRLTSHGPVAIVVDALDDADQGDLAALLFAVRASAARPLLVVVGRDPSGSVDLARALSPSAVAVLPIGSGVAAPVPASSVDPAHRERLTTLVDEGRCRDALIAAGVWERQRGPERARGAVEWADVALAAVQAGRPDEGRMAASRALALASTLDPGDVPGWHVRTRTTEVLVAMELWRRASWSAGQCLVRVQQGRPTLPDRVPWVAMVQAFVRMGRAADAAATLDLAVEHATTAVSARCRAEVAAGAPDALERWGDAHRVAGAVGDLAGQAAVAMSLAPALRGAGRADEAAAVLAAARSWAVDVGAAAMLGRADALTRSMWPSAAGEFSAVEAAVADLVAAGRSNREIGNELMVSVRTVEAHLTRAFRKAGVRTRAELTAYWLARRA